MPDVIAVLWIALEHAELGPMTIAYEPGHGDPGARGAVGGVLGGGGHPRPPHCAALRGYRRFTDGSPSLAF
jgi:hypothetical protein